MRWNVPAVTVSSASSAQRRWRSSSAALRLNVHTRTWSGSGRPVVDPSCDAQGEHPRLAGTRPRQDAQQRVGRGDGEALGLGQPRREHRWGALGLEALASAPRIHRRQPTQRSCQQGPADPDLPLFQPTASSGTTERRSPA